MLAVDALVSQIEEGVNQLSGAAWERWADLNTRSHPTQSCMDRQSTCWWWLASHRGGQRCVVWPEGFTTAGIPYKIVGSTCLALHGVPVTPHDIDVETDAAGAFRIEALWPDAVVDPVGLREESTYRTHLGHLSIDGVVVEIMGGMERLDDGGWVSTADSTETAVELDGVPVRLAWLEEEALAYVRHGPLERTAQCLPYCDRDRLLALLRRGRRRL